MSIAGIDPGVDGAVAIRCDNASWVTFPMPMVGKELQVSQIVSELYMLEVERVVVEQQIAMPKQSVNGTATTFRNYGKILGALEAKGIPYQLVTPKQWKARVLKGTAKDKDAAIAYTHRIAPDVDLKPGKKKTPHDGIADAVCLAEYALMQVGAE